MSASTEQIFYRFWFRFDGVEFKPITINIHQSVIKIVDEEIYYDFQLNTTESVKVGRDRIEDLAKIQRG
jgi:hypothetical protein